MLPAMLMVFRVLKTVYVTNEVLNLSWIYSTKPPKMLKIEVVGWIKKNMKGESPLYNGTNLHVLGEKTKYLAFTIAEWAEEMSCSVSHLYDICGGLIQSVPGTLISHNNKSAERLSDKQWPCLQYNVLVEKSGLVLVFMWIGVTWTL